MRIAVAASALLHLGLIVVTMIAWPGFRSSLPTEDTPSIPIELVPIAEETNITPQVERPDEPEPPKEEIEEPEPPEPPEPPPPPKEPPPPPPEPEEPEAAPPPLKPEDEKKPEEEEEEPEEPEEEKEPPKPPKKPDPPPKKDPPKKVEKNPEENPFDQMASVLKDKDPEKQRERVFHEDGTETASGEFNLEGVGRQDDMTVSMIDALKYQISPCWNLDPGALNAGELVIEMVIYFNPDGTLRAGLDNPHIKNQGRYDRDSYFRAAADAAVMAVRQCEGNGYKLPPNTSKVDVTFDPSKMVGG